MKKKHIRNLIIYLQFQKGETKESDMSEVETKKISGLVITKLISLVNSIVRTIRTGQQMKQQVIHMLQII